MPLLRMTLSMFFEEHKLSTIAISIKIMSIDNFSIIVHNIKSRTQSLNDTNTMAF
jgi:hypothetical protein